MAKDVAQLLQSWLPTQPSADVASQQRILELEAELAKVKSAATTSPATAPPGSTPATTPIGRALQGQPAASTTFDPSTLLISPGSVNTWLVDKPTYIIVGHSIYQVVESLEATTAQTGHPGEELGKGQ